MLEEHNVAEFTVSEFSRNIKRIIEDAFGYVKIKGEISGFKKAGSGHIYFSLKDENAVISAVCFRGAAENIAFEIGDGIAVTAFGKITTYEGRSNYQIIVEKLEIAGIGAIMEAIENRRKKLLAEGLFDEKYKKPLPFFPNIIGVITSPTGAVIEDIIHRLTERFPVNLLIYPVKVQGKSAAVEVIQGIKYFNRSKNSKPDLIIIARGGGSFEDLLPFNDEELVREVFKSDIPIISAIGHETDTTLIDYVSDMRAPTPTAAAEIATPLLSNLKTTLNNLEKRLISYPNNFLEQQKNNLTKLAKYLIHPKQFFANGLEALSQAILQLKNNLIKSLNNKEQNFKLAANLLQKPDYIIDNYQKQLAFAIKDLFKNQEINFKNYQNRVELNDKLLNSYNYKQVLKRGYALIRDNKNNFIGSTLEIKNNQQLLIEMSDGNVDAIALKQQKNFPKQKISDKKEDEYSLF
jgi:exodeoxyribonuclease VII large subunit